MTPELLTPEESSKLLHELRVHQIELEAQNAELRRAHEELEATKTRYFDLYDLAPVGYLTFCNAGLVREANLTAANMLGVVRGDLIGSPLPAFIFSEDQEVYLHRKQFVEAGEFQAWEMRLVRADNSFFWAYLQATPWREGEYLITFYDISERKQAEEEKLILEQLFQQSQKLESLGVLAGGIAHDFNNILSIIIGRCSIARMTSNINENHLLVIEKAAERATGLCRQMLVYAGKSPLVTTQVNMRPLVDEMLQMLKSAINKKVIIKPNLSGDIPLFKGDPNLIRQIVMNLIINASEAIGEEQGEIKVSLSQVAIRNGQHDKDYLGKPIPPSWYACLEVTDNGCGMNEETKQRIFEPFYTTKFTGRGLGMSAIRGIIAAHKGALQFYSNLRQGTTFKVYLPIKRVEEVVAIKEPEVSQTVWRGKGTILLVEDETEILFVAKTMLEALGFKVIEALNGKEALEQYNTHASDLTLVMTDIGMPIMDGYELFHELKVLNPHLPIIVSSGFGDTVVTSRIVREAVAGFVNKPYNFEQLREVLKSVLEPS